MDRDEARVILRNYESSEQCRKHYEFVVRLLDANLRICVQSWFWEWTEAIETLDREAENDGR